MAIPIHLHVIYGGFHDTMPELQQRPYGPQDLKDLPSGSLQKKFDPWDVGNGRMDG